MKENIGSKEQKIRIAIGAAATAVAIFVPLRYKWKGILSAIAFDNLFSGVTGFAPLKRVFSNGR
jgi:preprotein translocase subunit SecD